MIEGFEGCSELTQKDFPTPQTPQTQKLGKQMNAHN